MDLIEHQPDRKLLLRLDGMPGGFGSFVGVVVLAGITFGPLAWAIVWAPYFELITFTGLLALVGLVLFGVRVTVHLELTRESNRWRSVTGSLGFMLRREQRLHLDTIDRLTLECPFTSTRSSSERHESRTEDRPLGFDLTALNASGTELGSWEVKVAGHVTPDHGIELLTRMAGVVGLPEVRVLSRDAKRLRAEATRDPAASDPDATLSSAATPEAQSAGTPGSATPASPDPIDGDGVRDGVPALVVHPPPHLRSRLGFEITRWSPGVIIELRKPWRLSELGLYPIAATTVLVLLASAQLHPWLLALFPDLPVDPANPAFVLIAFGVWCVAVGGTIAVRRVDGRFGVKIDWPYRRFRIERRPDTLEIPFARLENLELRGVVREVKDTRPGGSSSFSSTRTVYTLVLVAHFSRPDRAVELVETGWMPGSCDEDVYEWMSALTRDIAAELEVPHRFSDFRHREQYGELE